MMAFYRQSAEIILASASPRRKQMLTELGIQFRIEISNVEELPAPGEGPEDVVRRFALDKARTVAKKNPHAWVLGADTDVSVDGLILGKPNDVADAVRLLGLIQGRRHDVWGAFALVNQHEKTECIETGLSQVQISPLDSATISRYVATGEPMDKAGAYAVQGLGAHFIESVSGSYSNVVGLDLAKLLRALRKFGILS
jgi:septum formation protein